MLGSVMLREANLHHHYTRSPPELVNVYYPISQLRRIKRNVAEVEYEYYSHDPNLIPHRFRLVLNDQTPRLSLGCRVWLRDYDATTFQFLEDPDSYIVDGWIIGVHFEVRGFIEYTVLGWFDGVLQLVFLDVPHSFIDTPHSPPHTVLLDDECYWSYLTPFEVEQRARVLQRVGSDLKQWSPTYVQVQDQLMLLRWSNVSRFELIDLVYFPEVSKPSLIFASCT